MADIVLDPVEVCSIVSLGVQGEREMVSRKLDFIEGRSAMGFSEIVQTG